MQHRIRAASRRLQPHLAGGGMEQGQDLGCAAADVFVRLRRWSPSRLPGWARMRHRLKRPCLVLTPNGQPKLGAERIGLLDQPLTWAFRSQVHDYGIMGASVGGCSGSKV